MTTDADVYESLVAASRYIYRLQYYTLFVNELIKEIIFTFIRI